jgi:hypothetical protein
LPWSWLAELELRDAIDRLARDPHEILGADRQASSVTDVEPDDLLRRSGLLVQPKIGQAAIRTAGPPSRLLREGWVLNVVVDVRLKSVPDESYAQR